MLLAIATVALAAVQYAEQAETLSPANAFLAKVSVTGATIILLFVWFVALSRASRTVRVRVGLIGVVLVALTAAMFRIEGVTGDILPRLRLRWAPHDDQTLAKLETPTDSDPVDLTTTTATDYPQYLGPDRLSSPAPTTFDHDWAAHPPKLLWKQPIGAAWSSFAVVGPFAVTQEQRGDEELITCYEVETGKPRWVHSTPVRFEETLAGIGPRATPTIHEGKVYALGALGHLTCLDGATGKKLWQHNIVTENDAIPPIWGKSCSPLIHDNKVIVSAGGANGKSLVALDKDSGEQLWSGGDDSSSYSSPVLMTLDGVPQIVIANATTVTSHDPSDGHVLWQHPWPEANSGNATPTVAQPVAVGNDRILLTKGYGTGSALWHIKHDGDKWEVEPVWRNNFLKTKFTNPVIRDGYVYALDEGILQCVEIDSGKRAGRRASTAMARCCWSTTCCSCSPSRATSPWSPPILRQYREVARFTAISGTAWNPPALAGRKLLVRSNQEAACYELPAASP